MYRDRDFYKGGFFHIYSRGVRKMPLFLDFQDYQFFLKRLSEYRALTKNQIIAFVIMDNHYHLLIRAYDGQSISQMIMRLNNSYAKTYNKKYQQSGHVFQGRYSSVSVKSLPYLLFLSRYIHRNPTEVRKDWQSYIWSSYPRYIEKVRRGSIKLDKQFVTRYFESPKEYQEFCLMTDKEAKRYAAKVCRKHGTT